jgi:hypothetical protein
LIISYRNFETVEDQLEGKLYSPLRDPAEFARVKIDPTILHDWPEHQAAFRAAAQRWSHAMA